MNSSAENLDDNQDSVDGQEPVVFREIRELNGKKKLRILSEAPRSSVEYIHVLCPSRMNATEIEESPPRRVREPRKIIPIFEGEDLMLPEPSPSADLTSNELEHRPLAEPPQPDFDESERQMQGLGNLNRQHSNAVSNFRASALQIFSDHITQNISTSMANFEKQMMNKLTDMDQKVETVRTEIMELRAIGGQAICTGVCASKRTPLAIFEEKLDHLTPHAVWIFDTPTVSRLLSAAVTHCVTTMIYRGGAIQKRSDEGIQTLLFAKQPGEKKYTYKEGIGKAHSLFRLMLVKNAVYNVQRNMLRRFEVIDDNNLNVVQKETSREHREVAIRNVGKRN